MTAQRAQAGYTTATARIAHQIEEMTVPRPASACGHMQRGGSPSAYDRVLATQFGSYGGQPCGGRTLRRDGGHGQPPRDRQPRLPTIAGKTRGVPGDCDMVNVARAKGISLG